MPGGGHRLTWGNEGAEQLLGYGVDDLYGLPVEQLFPSLGGGELKLLLRRERAARMTLPVRTANGASLEAVVITTPSPGGRMWTVRLLSTANAQERALRATADAHERRFSALTERSPIPTLLSEQGMRLAHVNDAFCALVGRRAEQLLGTGWIDAVHEDDLDGVIEQVAAALDGGEVDIQARLVREDGAVRMTIIRFAHLFTPGVGAGFVGTIEDITDRLAFETKLAHQANHDPLTGLPNRTLLAAVRRRPLPARHRRPRLPLPRPGQLQGRQRLPRPHRRRRAARRGGQPAARHVRPSDLVARFGGDEFVVVCEGVDEADAVALAERISIALAHPMHLGGVDIRPYASVGVTVQTAEHTAAEDLIRDCDIAMYQAKAGGKGRITVLDQQARAEARDKLRLVADLRDAIERREITLYYQPIFATRRRRSVAVESLARWEHPERGMISPATFVPLAEESGLIAGLGLLVLDETCRQLAEWDQLLGQRGTGAGQRQRLGAAARRQPRRPGGRGPAPAPAGAVADLDRDHRVRPDEGSRVGARHPRGAAAPRRGAGDRRLRDRLLVAGLPAAPAGGLPEGGPVASSPSSPTATPRSPPRSSPWPAPSTSAPSPRASRPRSRPRSSPGSVPPTCRASCSPGP